MALAFRGACIVLLFVCWNQAAAQAPLRSAYLVDGSVPVSAADIGGAQDSVKQPERRKQKKTHRERTVFPLLEYAFYGKIAGGPHSFLRTNEEKPDIPPEKIEPSGADAMVRFETGAIRNISANTGIGATVYWSIDLRGSGGAGGLAIRYRKWLSRDVSVDLVPGILFAGMERRNLKYPGWTAGVELTKGDLITATLMQQAVPTHTRGTESSLYLGAKVGSGKGVLWQFGVPLVLIILLSIGGGYGP